MQGNQTQCKSRRKEAGKRKIRIAGKPFNSSDIIYLCLIGGNIFLKYNRDIIQDIRQETWF